MNKYNYEDIEIGLKHSFSVSITEEYMEMFQMITGDNNSLHSQREFAIEKGFKKEVVYGMLVASYYSTLAGVYIPGENSLIHSIETKFLKPAYVGDFLTIEGVVTEKNDTFKLLTIKGIITNQDKIKISKAIIKVGVI